MTTLSVKLLRLFHPKSEQERREERLCMARAFAEVEDLQRTLNGHMGGIHLQQGIVLKKK